MPETDFQTDSYLRIAALSVALYDYFLTLPAEWRFYRSQSSILHLSIACTLFILIRYSSILILFVSNYGYFATSFTQESCNQFFMVAPVLKGIYSVHSEIYTNRYRRVGSLTSYSDDGLAGDCRSQDRQYSSTKVGNCSAGNSGTHLSAWVFHLLSMVYDLVAMTISTVFLFKMNIRDKRFSRLPKIMFYDGLGYFAILTVANIVNMIFYLRSRPALQSSASNLGFAMIWIMSQRILIHLRELAADSNKPDSVVLARNPQSSKDIGKTIRSPIDTKSPSLTNADVELAVQVRVEQTVSVEYESQDHESDHHPKPSKAWDF
ncbi:hypothetical protein PILCRDRAFT_1897 [Piloderma croceum F 1598]|uniref:DUF6533 domain-containing protein n=1 Tax=Piloderma croceum (strain F 1598) TaxID=765440 RepID=A0A0C3BSM9_PILCF|nr:hypothetical protein PILCRDRAFT_1897 [Piloderma croceum F 1598]